MLTFIAIFAVSLVVSLAICSLMKPKTPDVKPVELDQFQIPTVKSGEAIPVVFGTIVLTNAAIVWYGDLDYIAVRSRTGAGDALTADANPDAPSQIIPIPQS